MTVARLYAVHLRAGGGADVVFDMHMPDARADRGDDIVGEACIDSPGEECTYCGIRQGEPHDA